jgi:uncharacterized protein
LSFSGLDLLPYIFLFLAVICSRLHRQIDLVLVGAAVLSALALERVTAPGLIWISVLGISIWFSTVPTLSQAARRFALGIFTLVAIGMAGHLLPGFHNLKVYDKALFSEDALPFSMYLNFDKVLVGLFLCLFMIWPRQKEWIGKKDLLPTLSTWALLCLLILPVALLVQYVRFDPKLPPLWWLWSLNNLFFVCLAEEAFFRGFIQHGLVKLLPKQKLAPYLAILITAILFGFAHYQGGAAYIGLATIAGIFYGYAYYRTGKLEASMLVHFGLNLTHFLFFSYPALAR